MTKIKFGIELETLCPDGTTRRILNSLPSHRGVDGNQQDWHTCGDGSLRPNDDEVGCEFVSGVHEFDASSISWLYESTKLMKSGGARVNRSCGFHLSTSTFAMDSQKLHQFLKMAKHYQQVFIGIGACPNRENADWCKPWSNDMMPSINPDSISESNIPTAVRHKYRWLNIGNLEFSRRNIPEGNRLELRSPTGTLNPDKISAIANLWCSFYKWTQCDNMHFQTDMTCNSKGVGSKALDELLNNIGYTNRGRRNRHFNFHVAHAKQSRDDTVDILKEQLSKYDIRRSGEGRNGAF